MKKADNHTKPKKRKGAWGCLIGIILIFGIYFLFMHAPYLGKEKAADTEISQMTPQLKPGLSRDIVVGILEAHGFRVNTTAPPKKDPEHRQVFMKICKIATMYSWVRYDAFIEYDENGQLKFARLLKIRKINGGACSIIFEIPSDKNKTYPFSCPADVQEF